MTQTWLTPSAHYLWGVLCRQAVICFNQGWPARSQIAICYTLRRKAKGNQQAEVKAESRKTASLVNAPPPDLLLPLTVLSYSFDLVDHLAVFISEIKRTEVGQCTVAFFFPVNKSAPKVQTNAVLCSLRGQWNLFIKEECHWLVKNHTNCIVKGTVTLAEKWKNKEHFYYVSRKHSLVFQVAILYVVIFGLNIQNVHYITVYAIEAVTECRVE